MYICKTFKSFCSIVTDLVSTDKASIKNHYLKIDIYILPSYHEGFPSVLYESVLLGPPVLTTFVSTIPYLMKDGLNCYKLNVKDVNSIAQQIQLLISNYSENGQVAINATKTFSTYLTSHSRSQSNLLSKTINAANYK